MATDDSSDFWLTQGPIPDKVCTKCRQKKPISEFRQRKRKQWLWRDSVCRSCCAKYSTEYNRNDPQGVHRRHIKWRYGLPIERYEAALKAQGGLCAICRGKNDSQRLHVDHCHETGEFRGLLCFKCNAGIGKLCDSIELLQAAIAYLEKFNRSDRNRACRNNDGPL